jgi:hypothetical protein
MEWASRVAVGQTTARSLDRRIGRPSTSSKHPRGDHPSRTGSCVPGWSWTNTLNRARMVTCLMTCQARRPPRWAPRHVPVGSSLSAVCRPKTADECVGPAVDPLEPSQDGRRGRRARSRSTRTVPRRPASVPSPQSIHSNRPKTAGECAEPAVDPLEPSQDGRRVCRARSRSTRTVPRRPKSVSGPQLTLELS